MSTHEKRLDDLERTYHRPDEPAGPPWDPSLLTAGELAELDDLQAVLASMDVGPGPRDGRADLRTRLDGLTDAQLHRLQVLMMKGLGQDTTAERTKA